MDLFLATEKHLQALRADKFGYANLSKKILGVLLRMELPNCFGLFGNWGSGKSTMLHFILEQIKQDHDQGNIKAIYFEPWKYEYAEKGDLFFALLKKIKDALSPKKTALTKMWKGVFADVLTIGTWGLKNLTKVLPVPEIDVKEISKKLTMYEELLLEKHETWVDKTEQLKENLERAIKENLGKDDRLFIFVDDLDRCLPENAVNLLECIKNFLSVENTLFIIAVDKRVVSEMIQRKYGLDDGYGQEYLMKIIPYFYDLPSVKTDEVVKEILDIHGISLEERDMTHIIEFIKKFTPEPRRAKYFLHNFGMKFSLANEELREYAKSRYTDSDLNHASRIVDVFKTIFLMERFPKMFAPGVMDKRLHLIDEYIKNGQAEKQDRHNLFASQIDFLSKSELKRVQEIFNFAVGRPTLGRQILEAYRIIEKEFQPKLETTSETSSQVAPSSDRK